MYPQPRVQMTASLLPSLQAAVNAELTLANLYWARSVFWRSRGIHRLAEYYKKQSGELHTQLSADRMAFLGSQPALSPEPLPPTQGTLSAQFTEELQGEASLSDRYSEWIKQAASVGDFVTEDIWRAVLKETQEHCIWLQQQLEQMTLMGEGVYLARVWGDTTEGP